MPKNLLQDMVKSGRSKTRQSLVKKTFIQKLELEDEKNLSIEKSINRPPYKIWIVAFFSVIFCFHVES